MDAASCCRVFSTQRCRFPLRRLAAARRPFCTEPFAASKRRSQGPSWRRRRPRRTLANMAPVSRLPDRGQRIKKQIHELDEKLAVIDSSPDPESSASSSRGASDEVICFNDEGIP